MLNAKKYIQYSENFQVQSPVEAGRTEVQIAWPL